jgi:hypothetical protein
MSISREAAGTVKVVPLLLKIIRSRIVFSAAAVNRPQLSCGRSIRDLCSRCTFVNITVRFLRSRNRSRAVFQIGGRVALGCM